MHIDDVIVAFSALEMAAGNPIAQVEEDIGKAGLTLNVQGHVSVHRSKGFVLDFEKGRYALRRRRW